MTSWQRIYCVLLIPTWLVTFGSPASAALVSATLSDLYISEVRANPPVGDADWFEVINVGATAITLANLIVVDANNNSTTLGGQ